MKIIGQLLLTICFLLTGLIYSQNPDRAISEETTKKKYEMYEEGKLVKKSIEIHTVIRQDIKLAEEDEDKVDARRILTPKKISKTVSIDNDSDEAQDEVIKFSYTSDADDEFLFGTNDDEIFEALENSKYLNLKNSKKLSEERLNSLFVITDNNGKALQLILNKHNPIE